MATPLTAGTIQVSAQAKISGAKIAPQGTATSVTLTAPSVDAIGNGQAMFTFGTGAGQCDILCAADYDLAAGASVEIDLFANGLPNVYGGTADFRKLKVAFVGVQGGGDAAGVTIGGSAANPHPLFFGAATSTWTIEPNQSPFSGSRSAGIAVDATHRMAKLTNNGAVPVTLRVLLGGTSV